MSDHIPVEEMAVSEIASLLNVTEDQAAAVRDFIQQVGGIEKAFEAIEFLDELPKAA